MDVRGIGIEQLPDARRVRVDKIVKANASCPGIRRVPRGPWQACVRSRRNAGNTGQRQGNLGKTDSVSKKVRKMISRNGLCLRSGNLGHCGPVVGEVVMTSKRPSRRWNDTRGLDDSAGAGYQIVSSGLLGLWDVRQLCQT